MAIPIADNGVPMHKIDRVDCGRLKDSGNDKEISWDLGRLLGNDSLPATIDELLKMGKHLGFSADNLADKVSFYVLKQKIAPSDYTEFTAQELRELAGGNTIYTPNYVTAEIIEVALGIHGVLTRFYDDDGELL
jgi:hypothetical protein